MEGNLLILIALHWSRQICWPPCFTVAGFKGMAVVTQILRVKGSSEFNFYNAFNSVSETAGLSLSN